MCLRGTDGPHTRMRFGLSRALHTPGSHGLTGPVGLSSHPFLALGLGFPVCPWAERPRVV